VFRDIVVAVDGSSHADQALSEAIDMARQNQGSLTLVTVMPELTTWALGSGFTPAVDYQALHDDLEREYRKMLDAAQAKAPPEVPSRALLLEGRPGQWAGSHIIRHGGRLTFRRPIREIPQEPAASHP
jgi:nucleotide-binding universal stress UspA family protein